MFESCQDDKLFLLVSISESRVELASVGGDGGEVGAPTSISTGV
jgi:hypothetical protein